MVKISVVLEKVGPSVAKKNVYFKNTLFILACYLALIETGYMSLGHQVAI